jgi:hypothetical protein
MRRIIVNVLRTGRGHVSAEFAACLFTKQCFTRALPPKVRA